MHEPQPQAPATPPADAATPDVKPRTITSEDLLRGAQELLIEHRGELYRLRLTRNDKLILTK